MWTFKCIYSVVGENWLWLYYYCAVLYTFYFFISLLNCLTTHLIPDHFSNRPSAGPTIIQLSPTAVNDVNTGRPSFKTAYDV